MVVRAVMVLQTTYNSFFVRYFRRICHVNYHYDNYEITKLNNRNKLSSAAAPTDGVQVKHAITALTVYFGNLLYCTVVVRHYGDICIV